MRILIPFLLCISTSFIGYSQDDSHPSKPISKNSLFFEGLGNSLLYGINYDRLLINKEKWKFSGRVGFSYFPPVNYLRLVFPTEFTFLIGKKKHFFEVG